MAKDLARIKENVLSMVNQNAPEADIDTYIRSEGVSLEDVRSFGTKQPPFLPGFSRTEGLISGRQDAGQSVLGEVEKIRRRSPVDLLLDPTANPVISTNVLAASTLGAGFQKVQSVLANVMLEAQEGRVQESGIIGELEKRIPQLWTIPYFKAVKKGLTGERIGEFGDVFRRVGVPDPISATLGFFVSVGITNLATKGKLVEGTQKAKQFALTRKPKIFTKDYMINQAKLASGGLDDLYEGISKEYDDLFAVIGNKPVNVGKVQDLIDDLPQNIISKIARNKSLTKNADGSMQATINNLKVLKGILRKFVPDRVWSGRMIGDATQGEVKSTYYDINKIMAEGNDDLVALNKKYSEFRNLRGEISKVIYDGQGNVRSKGLETLYKRGAERNKQIFFEKFASLWPKGKDVIRDSISFARRTSIKQGIGRAVRVGAGGYIGYRILNNLLGFGGGGGDQGE